MKSKALIVRIGAIAALAGGLLLYVACPSPVDEPEEIPIQEEPTQEEATGYTVSFDVGTGGGTAPASQTVVSGAAITLPGQGGMTAPEDHTFEGWETGGRFYEAASAFTVTANTEFTAQWKSGMDPNKTYVEFNNLEQFPVVMYSDSSRQMETARVPAQGKKLVEVEPKPQGTVFYPQFLLEFEGIPLSYNGSPVMLRVDEKKVNQAHIPRLTSVETGSAFIKIENKSAYSLTFNKGSYELPPLGASSNIVMPTESAGYRIEPGAASQYRAMKNGSIPIAFPTQTLQFEAEMLYVFAYDGNALTLNSTAPLLQALTMLPAPSQTAVRVVSSSSISLTWAVVEKAVSYKVYRSNALDGEYVFLETLSASPYTGENLSEGTSYYYKVQAVNEDRESPLSAAAGILILPAAPGLSAKVEEAAKITLSWTAAAGAGEYQVYRSSDPEAEYGLLDRVSALTYTDENVSAGTEYFYRIQAVNTQTAGASPFAEITARILTAPQLSVQVESATSITLNWAELEGATAYKLYRSSSPDTGFTLIETLSERAYTDQGLSEGSAYYYKLQGSNSQGDGVLSPAAPIKILPAPQDVQAEAANTEACITLSWTAATGATSYQVYRSTSSDTGFEAVGTTSSLSYTDDENLNGGTTYYYKIQTLNTTASGKSPLSAVVSATTPVLIAISNLTYSSISGGTWEVQSDGSRKSPSIGYGGMTKARVSFTSNAANASVTIQLRVYTYDNSSVPYNPHYNYAFISELDNAAASASDGGYYTGSRIDGATSVSITIPVPNLGNHFIDIGYQNGDYYASSEYRAWFTVTNY
jgi:fibronectin type 3 domain-containing protein